MTALQIWLENHNRRLTQAAIDEALMEYIAHVEKQRDELLKALEDIAAYYPNGWAADRANQAIACVKGQT